MPDMDLLPEDLSELVDRQAEFVEYRTFETDVDRLMRNLQLQPPAEVRMRAEGRIKVDASFVHGAPDGWFKPGNGKAEWFKDYEFGPELVVVPAGEFLRGSKDHRKAKPVGMVRIPSPFAVGRFPVTFAEWDANASDGCCDGHRPSDRGWGRDKRPVIDVSWNDAKRYIDYLNAKTGKGYRLLSEAEREYVTRAGTTTPFWWGSKITPMQANYDSRMGFSIPQGEFRGRTMPVESFEENPWGLFNVHGNIWEWCEDIWHNTYRGAPTDGSAWLPSVGAEPSRAFWGASDDFVDAEGRLPNRRVVRGGSWNDVPDCLHAAYRDKYRAGRRIDLMGFRLARTLNT